jgi:heterotetrameric sarcosine oxidase gamma subunit
MSITVTVREGLGLAKVLSRRDGRAALRQHFQVQFGLALPDSPRRVSAQDVAVVGLGPGAWLATHETAGNDWARQLESVLGASASISDQSDSYVLLRLQGFAVRETLAKLVPIDVHQRVFTPGQVAETVASHMGVILWRLEDDPQGAPVFELAVSRSIAASLFQALLAATPNSESVARLAAGHTMAHT